MKELENLKELYVDEIKKINKKGELTPTDSEAAKKALEAIKMIDMLCEDEIVKEPGYSERMYPRYSRNDGGYSERRYSRSDGGYSTMMPETMYNPNMGPYYSSYEGDRSMARGRDSFGRYTSRNNGMSRNYSRHSTASHMVEQLEDMLTNTTDERKRMVIQNCIEELESY